MSNNKKWYRTHPHVTEMCDGAYGTYERFVTCEILATWECLVPGTPGGIGGLVWYFCNICAKHEKDNDSKEKERDN